MKKIIQSILRVLAQLILRRYRPDVIGITGSVGKTSTKEAIFTVLNYQYRARRNVKNYNNELGVPLTIIGAESGQRSVIRWLKVFLKALWLILIKSRDYPEILVLEMAADHPGDIDYLTKLAPCKIGVVTALSSVHLEFFGNIENIIQEKMIMIKHLTKEGTAILNADDEVILKNKEKTKAKVLTFGFGDQSDLRAIKPEISQEIMTDNFLVIRGMDWQLSYQGESISVFLPRILGRQHIYSALVGAAIGLSYGLNLREIADSLGNYRPPRGRMNLLPGIKKTLLIDDTYNSSPLATKAALESLATIQLPPTGRRMAVLGDMLELGNFTEMGHRQVGEKVAALGIDTLITVGERAQDIADEALDRGMKAGQVFSFDDSIAAGRFIQDRLHIGDVILIKGSQGVRMEKIVKEIMAEPLRAKELLVRQEDSWDN